jgi:hypothetical protein
VYQKWDDLREYDNHTHVSHILFSTGCRHGDNGCTDDIYFAKLVKEYTYEGIVYEGMAYFKSFDECVEKLPGIGIVWECTCNRKNKEEKDCMKAHYPKKTNSENYYDECHINNIMYNKCLT